MPAQTEKTRRLGRVVKSDADLQVFWTEVYAADFPDSQGDYMTKDEVRKMAWNFLAKGRTSAIDRNHDRQEVDACVVESFFNEEGPNRNPMFLPNAWVVGIHVADTEIWKDIVEKQEINGVSLEGIATQVQPSLLLMDVPESVVGVTDTVNGHAHNFQVVFSPEGEFMGGKTTEDDGHSHTISKGTLTDMADGHAHRYSFAEGLLTNAAS